MPRAVALFSGGLDSMLSVRVLQRQGFQVDALNVRTIYSCCQADAAQTAVALGARLTVVPVADDYIEVIRNPLYGYGKGLNPCVDCRIYMCRMARRLMEELGADLVVTGEIVGQRPMSQKRHQLEIIARRSGLEGRLLRPLSAKLLPPTEAEVAGLVDREQLYGFSGRGRRELCKLAEQLGVPDMPTPSTGCALAEPSFARRVRDLLQFRPHATRWEFELLNHGRHIRFDARTKVAIGRNANDNAMLRMLAAREDAPGPALLVPENFRGPDALAIGRLSEASLAFAGELICRFAGGSLPAEPQLRVARSGTRRVMCVGVTAAALSAEPL